MSPTYLNGTIPIGVVTYATPSLYPAAAATVAAMTVANKVNTCDCEALRTAVVLFSGLDAGILAVALVLLFWRRSKWIKKGASQKQAEYEKVKEKKGLLSRQVARQRTRYVSTVLMRGQAGGGSLGLACSLI